jgi:chemotaxis protein CheX
MSNLGITTEEAVALAIEVWRGFLGVVLVPCASLHDKQLPEPSISACVTIKGSWYGGIVVTLPASLGFSLTRSVLTLDDPEQDDVCDVIGELANMMAGRLKYRLPPDTQISLPMVATGDHFDLSIPGASVALALDFEIDGTPLRVRIIRVEESQRPTTL